ncbi:MAG TPA: dodecin family protein [Chloroflexia bacterium]|nr:dodecin family protein [Chloroflexia bacterium]
MTSIVKVIEVIAESDQGWEQAAQDALMHASRTVRNIKSIYVENFQGVVENNRIVRYRLNAKISFVIEEGDHAG